MVDLLKSSINLTPVDFFRKILFPEFCLQLHALFSSVLKNVGNGLWAMLDFLKSSISLKPVDFLENYCSMAFVYSLQSRVPFKSAVKKSLY